MQVRRAMLENEQYNHNLRHPTKLHLMFELTRNPPGYLAGWEMETDHRGQLGLSERKGEAWDICGLGGFLTGKEIMLYPGHVSLGGRDYLWSEAH